MNRRSKLLWFLAALFTLLNLAGAIYAAAHRELAHTAVHEALVLAGAYFVWRLTPRNAARI